MIDTFRYNKLWLFTDSLKKITELFHTSKHPPIEYNFISYKSLELTNITFLTTYKFIF